jgi:hypothetical protein
MDPVGDHANESTGDDPTCRAVAESGGTTQSVAVPLAALSRKASQPPLDHDGWLSYPPPGGPSTMRRAPVPSRTKSRLSETKARSPWPFQAEPSTVGPPAAAVVVVVGRATEDVEEDAEVGPGPAHADKNVVAAAMPAMARRARRPGRDPVDAVTPVSVTGTPGADRVAVCGGSRNGDDFRPYFTEVFNLRIDDGTMRRRLQARTTDDWTLVPDPADYDVALAAMIELMLELNRSDDKPAGAIDVDATQPLDQVVDELLRLAKCSPPLRD